MCDDISLCGSTSLYRLLHIACCEWL